jgi:hypothetical protein
MLEFLQSYGIWIFLGLLFLLMLRGHSHGTGCCGGGHQHDQGTSMETEQPGNDKHGSGCH